MLLCFEADSMRFDCFLRAFLHRFKNFEEKKDNLRIFSLERCSTEMFNVRIFIFEVGVWESMANLLNLKILKWLLVYRCLFMCLA